MNCCFFRAVKYRIAHLDRLCRSVLREWESFKDSVKAGEAVLLLVAFSFYLDTDTHASHSSSIST